MTEERRGDREQAEAHPGETGSEEAIDSEDARKAMAANEAHAIDIRGDEEWRSGHIPGAHHIPAEELEERADDFPTEGRIIIAAEDQQRAADAASKLRDSGHDAVALEGGMDAWRSEDHPMQPSTDPDEDAPV
ncbi:MAG TPA: rhodanese-like domain-containing protein [Solirubrobacterales bacterium]|nr:rhodanese-like domain-containing protein [Solirubrobacterales bacterium]